MKSLINNTIKESEKKGKSAVPEQISDENNIDRELEDIIKRSRAKIFVIGTGAGNNTVSRLTEIGVEGAATISVNTDAQDLLLKCQSENFNRP